jgi:hypothetical protein
MRKRKLYGGMLLVAVLIAVGLLLVSTGLVKAPVLREAEDENIPTSVYPPLTQPDEIQIFAAVIRHLRRGTGPVYILRTTDDRGGDPRLTQSNASVLSPSTQAGISTALSDLSSGVVWLDQFSEVERDPVEKGGRLKDGGVVITLGNLKTKSGTRVELVARNYRGSLDGAGYAYTVEKVRGVWAITELRLIWVS